jgi:hypothetical protein
MTAQPDKPKRGPGRPRKTPAPPLPPIEEQTDAPSELDWPQLIYEVVVEYDAPASPTDVAAITDFELARVTEILDGLVSDGRLILGDDQLYRLPPDPTDEQDIIGPPVTQEESDAAGAEPLVEPRLGHDAISRSRTVSLPTSDLYALFSHVNLPPELIAGFGPLSSISGELTYDLMDADGNDLEATCDFHVEIRGRHRITQPKLNPNQPGYQNPSAS